MEFREMTEQDMGFVELFSLYEDPDKTDHIDRIDWEWTLEHKGQILAVGGFRIITSCTAWCWCQLTEFAVPHLKVVYRTFREMIEGHTDNRGKYHRGWCEEHGITRLQAWVPVGFEEGVNIVEHLGFYEESMMHGFLQDNKPAHLFVKMMEK